LSKRILIIDDEQPILEAVETILEDMGYEVDGFSSTLEGEKAAIEGSYDLILMDIRMPERNGALATESILRKRPEAKILIITAYPADPLAKKALDAGAKALLKKPFEIGKILDFLIS
jgi:DNA-binding NtrC family response regulator